ncbi:MAG: septum formation initiator family protein [Bacillota bacterium]|nr:septum formation initiator family protein [Bacillota bacterium]
MKKNNKILIHPGRSGNGFTKMLLLIVFAMCMITVLYLFWGQTRAYLVTRGEINELSFALETFQAENERLKEEIMLLLHDHDYIEIQARKHLGMVRPGEIIFFVGE